MFPGTTHRAAKPTAPRSTNLRWRPNWSSVDRLGAIGRHRTRHEAPLETPDSSARRAEAAKTRLQTGRKLHTRGPGVGEPLPAQPRTLPAAILGSGCRKRLPDSFRRQWMLSPPPARVSIRQVYPDVRSPSDRIV